MNDSAPNERPLTEREKMLRGDLYDAMDPELCEARHRARELLHEFNHSRDGQDELRHRIHHELFGAVGDRLWIEPPFYCDYGTNIYFGDRVYFNFNCVILDVCEVRVGNDVLFGPAVQIYAATHPMDSATRRKWIEAGKPVTFGSDIWVGGGAIFCPGVTVGSRTVIGAGSVVTRDIPEGVFAAGNPCRVIREVE